MYSFNNDIYNNQTPIQQKRQTHFLPQQLNVAKWSFIKATIGVLIIFLGGFLLSYLIVENDWLANEVASLTLLLIASVFGFVAFILFIVSVFKLNNLKAKPTVFIWLNALMVISQTIILGIGLAFAQNDISIYGSETIRIYDVIFAFLGAAGIFLIAWIVVSALNRKQRFNLERFLWYAFIGLIILMLLSIPLYFIFTSWIIPVAMAIGALLTLVSVFFIMLGIKNSQDMLEEFQDQLTPQQNRMLVKKYSWFYAYFLVVFFMRIFYFILRILARSR